jgi:phenylpropionate dioxygenase-like ring-hydroxylating dioxygenase large terminal subunit
MNAPYFTVPAVGQLVREDRVHRSHYVDPGLFDLEMQRIFTRAWVYVGHESQVPNAGDFFSTTIGTQPVLLVRHSDGGVHVLHNRCGHRGALVCNETTGNTGRSFRCAYHGWSFRTNGELLAAPLKNGYPECYDLRSAEFGMLRIASEAYRGFVFANVAGDPFMPFDEYLRPMRVLIDEVVDRSPTGEIRVSRHGQRYLYRGNWKEQIDNGGDVYHPPYGHESTVSNKDRQFKRREGQDQGARIVDPDESQSAWDRIRMRAFPGGNNTIGSIPGTEEPRSGAVWEEYMALMTRAYGRERAEEIVREKFHAGVFYPNLILHLLSQHVRVVHPIDVDRTEVRVYPISLVGAPEELNRQVVRYLNVTHSPASLIQTDDLECFRRVHEGLRNSRPEWVVLGRGAGQDREVEGGEESFGTSEIAIRNYYRAWKQLMDC